MKRFSLLYILMCLFCSISAQDDTQNAIKEINQIKRSGENYFFAEATSQTWEEAIEDAKTLLSAQIEMWAKSEQSSGDKDIYVARASEHLFSIKATRGQLYRAFVYVKKTDLLALSSNDDILVVPVSGEEKPQVELVSSSPNQPQPRDEQIEAEIEENRIESDKAITIQAEEQHASMVEKIEYQLTTTERQMLAVGSFSGVSDFIRNLQGSNKISKMGKYADMPQDIDCYLFVYNPQGEIPAYLHKTAQGYFNLQSKTDDDIKNYKGCGALWFSLR